MRILLLSVGLGVIACALAQVGSNDGTPVHPKDFTVVQREGPVGHPERHRLIAVRSDGARAEMAVASSPSYTGWEPRVLILPMERKRYLIAERAQLISTIYLSERSAGFNILPKLSAQCKVEAGGRTATLVGEENILGVHTYHYSVPLAKTPGRRDGVVDRWLAFSLGCFPLQEYFDERSEQGSLVRVFERAPISFMFGKADSKVFEVPTAFREVTHRISRKKLSRKCVGNRSVR